MPETMHRRSMVGAAVLATFGSHAMAAPPKDFPPKPKWRPSFAHPADRVVDRFHYYYNRKRDFAVFENGTVAELPSGLTDAAARAAALDILARIYGYHPDMTPHHMDDGNVVVAYREPAANVVLEDIVKQHWAEIEARHLDGLTPDEVLITPLGQNVFDDFGKRALLGRAYMFMDAQAPKVVRIERAKA